MCKDKKEYFDKASKFQDGTEDGLYEIDFLPQEENKIQDQKEISS